MNKVIATLVALVFLAPGIVTAAEMVRFQWDYETNNVNDVQEFRLYQRLNDGAYDYDNPVFVGQVDQGFTETGSVRTYDQSVEITVPANQEGVLHFVMRAADESDNESGDSNEVSYPFDKLPPPAVIRFQLIISTQ